MKNIKKFFLSFILFLILFVGFMRFTGASTIDSANIPKDSTADTNYDLISVMDLSFNGLSNQEEIRINQDTDFVFDFSDNNIYKSLVFKFKYNVVDDSSSDSNAFRVHFDVADNKWDDLNSLWVRGDGIYLKKYNGSSFSWNKKPALNKGMHIIEFGRIAILKNSNPTGEYYVYYKIDDIDMDSFIATYDISKMDGSMFINYSSGNTMNKILDVSHIDGPYETPDRLSIEDLKYNGYSIGKEALLNEHHRYQYSSSAEHKSVSFKFYYQVNDYSSVDCQFHFNNTWLADKHGGIIWLRNDKIRISKEGGGYLETNPFTKNGLYEVDIKKLYINSGSNLGKYYISVAIDGVKALEYIISDMPDYAGLFTTGTNGDYLYDLNYMPIELDTDLYINKWDKVNSGISFIGKLKKDVVDKKLVDEVGFIITNFNDTNENTKLKTKLVDNDGYYFVKVALAGLNIENITKKYNAKLYYVLETPLGAKRTYYSDIISTSFYEELEDLSGLSESDKVILNELKSNVLNITIDEDDSIVSGATKTGDFDSDTIVLTGSKSKYTSFIVNGYYLNNGDLIKIGYRSYKVLLSDNKVTLTKQNKLMIYGGSEHFVETNSGHDEKMTAANLSPMARELGLKTVRLDINFNDLFKVSQNNKLTVDNSYVSKVQGIIDELKNNGGVTDFLAVLWTVLPYGFKTWDGKPWAGKTAPNPSTQADAYLKWLEINSEAARITAELFPDIRNFETWNEAEMMCELDGPLSKPDGSNYSVSEKAKILTDLMYYYTRGIKSVNSRNVLTTPSLCCAQNVDNDFDVTSPNFLKALYDAINDSIPVTGYDSVDKDPNNYFEVINIHPYLGRGTKTSNWKSFVTSFHTLSEQYNDSGTEIWITEFGFAQNREANAQTNMLIVLRLADDIDYLTKFYFYKIHDYTSKIDDDRWGLYDYDGNIKAIGTTVKNYILSKN